MKKKDPHAPPDGANGELATAAVAFPAVGHGAIDSGNSGETKPRALPNGMIVSSAARVKASCEGAIAEVSGRSAEGGNPSEASAEAEAGQQAKVGGASAVASQTPV
jgi:hypothetical protein